MPALIQSSRSFWNALALIATIGTFLKYSSERLRMAFVASRPFMTGIWISIRTKSNAFFLSRSSAIWPLAATMVARPTLFKSDTVSSWFISLSSTRRILASLKKILFFSVLTAFWYVSFSSTASCMALNKELICKGFATQLLNPISVARW